jgi:IgGFc binding protein/Concanavalin A-like lectin/glucanases superfamily
MNAKYSNLAKYVFLCFFLTLSFQSVAQIDKTFWFAAPENSAGHGDNPILMRFATFATPSVVTISMPANPGFTPIVINMAANAVATQDLTAFLAQVETPFDAGGVPAPQTTGILVESTANITAYYEVNRGNNPDIFALKGVNGLGNNFFLPFQTAWSTETSFTPAAHTGFIVVAVEDNTVITVTPTVALEGGRAAGIPYNITLNRGQSYCGSVASALAGGAPTGTRITSTRPIAVTMFHDSIRTGTGGCYDLAGDQMVPTTNIGTQYTIQRGFLDGNEQIIVTATQNGTNVTITNSVTTNVVLNAGQSTTVLLPDTEPFTSVVSSLPVYVAHYAGFGCETGAAILPPVNCTGSRNVRFVRSTDEYAGITLMTRVGNEDNFSFNGGAENTFISAAVFTPVPGLTGWVSARIELPLADLAAGAAGLISNSAGLFHLGLINGGASSGCRYGYFSSFNAVNLGPDIVIAYGTTVTLDAGPDGFSYLWSTGETTQTITVPIYLVGNYSVTVDVGNGCLLSDAVCVGTSEYVWTGFKDSNYNDPDNWSRPCGVVGVPNCNIDIVIPISANLKGARANLIITGNDACRDLWIEELAGDRGIMFINGGGRFNVCRNFRHEGTLTMQANSTLAFTGNVPQTYSRRTAVAVGEFENLIIANTTTPISNVQWPRVTVKDGVGLGNMIVSPTGTLTFQNGHLETENLREIVVRNRATTSVAGHAFNRFVVGRIRRHTNPTGAYDYPVGLAINNGNPVVDPAKTGTLTNMDPTTDWASANYCAGIGSTRVLDFDGGDDYVQMPVFAELSGNQPRTIEMWANVRSFTGNGGLFTFGDTNGLQDFSLRVLGSTDSWRMQHWAADYDFSTSTYNAGAGLLNTWAHYAVTYNGTQVCIYINGALVNCTNRALNSNLVSNFLAQWNNSFLNGQIDEVRIWNYARSVGEISSSLCTPISQCATAGLIAYYNFEEGTGTSITHKDVVCVAPTMTYQLANVDHYNPTNADNFLAYFTRYATVPTLTGQPLQCGADFNCQTLNNGFWTINAFNAANTQITGTGLYTMTLYNRDYTNAGVSCFSGIGDRGTVMKRANGAAPWAIPPGFCTNLAFASTGRSGMSGFSDFATTQGFTFDLLPVELVNFTARHTGENNVQAKWETISEKNVEKFALERSADGYNFTLIGTTNAVGNSNNRNNYTLTDRNAKTGINYYRLKALDFDGKFSFSKIEAVAIDENSSKRSGIVLYPNPTPRGSNLHLTGIESGNLRVSIINALGQIVFDRATLHGGGTFSLSPSLAAGVYTVQVFTDSAFYSEKVVLE